MEHRLDYIMNKEEQAASIKKNIEHYNNTYNNCILSNEEKKQSFQQPCSYYLEKYEYFKKLDINTNDKPASKPIK